MGSKKPWVVVRAVLDAVGGGATIVEAAALAGVSRRTVNNLIREHGVRPVRKHKFREGSLTQIEREDVFAGIKTDKTDAEIARELGRHRSTIGREIRRNGGRKAYRPHRACHNALENARRRRLVWTESRPWVWERVQELLRLYWSPEQISVVLTIEHPQDPHWWVSHESIYQAVFIQAKGELKRELVRCLRTQRARRVPHRRVPSTRGRIPGMVNISERPAEIEDRAVPGHWEGDLIVGARGGSQVATLVERSTRYAMLVKLGNSSAVHVADRLAEHIQQLPAELVRSLTWDQGKEMADHARFSLDTGVDVFFCDPRSPWQRGTNENFNGLVRQYLPKGTDLSVHSQDELDAIAHSLNTRPRKTLGWLNPAQALNQLVAPTA